MHTQSRPTLLAGIELHEGGQVPKPFSQRQQSGPDAQPSKGAARSTQSDVGRISTLDPLTRFGSERRVALVIGNADYRFVPRLNTPASDARAITGVLQKLGFRVILGLNIRQSDMGQLSAQFAQQLSTADLATLLG